VKSALLYLKITFIHKWFVFLAGMRTGAPIWRLIIHDWTKLLPWNLSAYGRQFFGTADRPREFIHCWIRHQNMHPHHWEYWIPRTGHTRCEPPFPDNVPVAMPMWAVREMVADWLGAGRTYEGTWPNLYDWAWFQKNHRRMRLHSDTDARIAQVIYQTRRKMANNA
jgi:hypothetical protein